VKPVNLTGDWGLLAAMHKPTDGDALQAEIRLLHQGGLKPRDISNTLRLGLGAVLEALRQGAA
jgi:hypothetical protein